VRPVCPEDAARRNPGAVRDREPGAERASAVQRRADRYPGGRALQPEDKPALARPVALGLVPLWAKDPSFGPKCINARSETVATNKIFREAFERRRCLVPADAFYEWRKIGGGKPVPYAVAPRQGMFAFAGLWERWRNPADGSILRSFTIVTGPANSLCRPIHERMPVILPPQAWPLWLGETETMPDQLLALLQGCPEEWLRVYPVGPAVGNVRHDEPGLLDPAGADLRAGDLLPV